MAKKFWESKIFDKIKQVVQQFLNPPVERGLSVPDPDSLSHNAGLGEWQTFFDDVLSRNAQDKEKYLDYELMDSEVPEITSALDVMSDFVVYPDNVAKTRMFTVTSETNDSMIDQNINDLNRATNFQNEFQGIVRSVCKYGDDFEEILKTIDTQTVARFKHIPVETVNIKMDNGNIDDKEPIEQYDSTGKVLTTLTTERVLHFSLPTDRKRKAIYGKGMSRIEKARLIYRQLRLMEEGVMIGRLSRANQNYGLVVDVGDLVGEEALEYMDKYKKRISRKKYIDNNTGRITYKFNPLSVNDDIIVPTRAGSSGNIITLNGGMGNSIDMTDINYFQNKMIFSVGVPKVLIGKEEDINSRHTADIQYISFLRTIRRIQTMMEPTLLKFYTLGLQSYGMTKIPNLNINWPTLGTIDEERQWRIMGMKVDCAAKLSTQMQMVDDVWIYENIMQMSEQDMDELIKRMDQTETAYEDSVSAELANASNLGNDKTDGGMGNGGAGNDPQTASLDRTKSALLENFSKNDPFAKMAVELFFEKDTKLQQMIAEYSELTKAKAGI